MSRPLRVVHVISTPQGVGGAERALADVVQASCHRGDDVLVLNPFVTPDGLPIAERLYAPAPVVGLPCRSHRELPLLLLRVRARLRAARPDIVHAHLFHAAMVVALLRGSTTAQLVLSHQHGDHFMASSLRMHEALDQWAGRRFTRVVGCSQAVADYLLYRYRYAPARVSFIRNGWSGSPLEPMPDDEPRVVCVARLRRQKDHPTLLRAFAGVRRVEPRAWLDLVGDGPERESLQTLASELGIRDRVVFHGDVADVWPLLSHATVFALSSAYEPLGIAALEAMAAGLPVVATDVGGLREVVRPGETGWLVPQGDSGRLEAHLTELLKDRARSAALGSNGRRAAEAHRSAAMAAAFLELYDQIAAAGAPESRPDRAPVRRAAFVALNLAKNMVAPAVIPLRRGRGCCGMDGDLRAVCDSLDRLAPVLAELSVDIAGKRVLEIGVGRTPEVCAATVLAGADHAHGVDVDLQIASDAHAGACYAALTRCLADGGASAFLASVGSDGAAVARRAEALGRDDWPLSFDGYGGDRLPCSDGSVDVVLSKSVLEHVRRALVRPLLAEMFRVLRPGGVMVHIIDLRDHLHIVGDGEVTGDWLDALRYSDRLFDAMFANRSTYINRLRLGEWRTAFAAAGLTMEVEHCDLFELPPGLDAGRFHSRYRTTPEADLSVGYLTVGARRPTEPSAPTNPCASAEAPRTSRA